MTPTLTRNTLLSLICAATLASSASAMTLGGEEVSFQKPSALTFSAGKSLRTLSEEDRMQTVLAKMSHPLSAEEKQELYDAGVETIRYADDLTYYIYASQNVLKEALGSFAPCIGIATMKPQYKTSEETKSQTELSTFGAERYIHLKLLFLQEMAADEVAAYLHEHSIDADVEKARPQLRSATVYCAASEVQKLSALPLVEYLEPIHELIGVSGTLKYGNLYTAKDLDVEGLWSGAYHLDGRGMKVGIVDGGSVLASHREFQESGHSRVHLRTQADVNGHATHVAGTIGAAGVQGDVRGMANKSILYSYYYMDASFADAAIDLYRNDGILFSNHSYGYSEKVALGEYDSYAQQQDAAVHQNPYINMFEAAGNDGNKEGYGVYGIIKGPGNSKNVLTIGALDQFSVNPAPFSSCGPVKDGRIKPELVTRGSRIRSTYGDSDESYGVMSGTSMATPAATGTATLVGEMYKRLTGEDIRHDLLTSALINCAQDRGRKGPDYQTGFGMIDGACTVGLISTIAQSASEVTQGSVSHGGRREYRFTMPQGGTFKATLSWVDPEKSPAAATSLTNDLDMVLVDAHGRHYYPYTLDPQNPEALAKQDKANHVDNIEQIAFSLPAGSYTLVVKGTQVIEGAQEYAIAANLPIFSSSHIQTLQASSLKSFARTMLSKVY